MLMKVFPHGTGEGDKPSRYLVRPDYPGRDTAPQVLHGDLAMTRALIDSIERRWKFTSGALPWHPDEKISEAQEEEVMDAFERVAFAGLEAEAASRFQRRRTLRLTLEEDERIIRLAVTVGISVSEYLRRLFFGGRSIMARTDN